MNRAVTPRGRTFSSAIVTVTRAKLIFGNILFGGKATLPRDNLFF